MHEGRAHRPRYPTNRDHVNMANDITSKIVGFRIKDDAKPTIAPEKPLKADLDPLTLRIERRPEGSLAAVSEKITYSDSEGRKRIYVLVSFLTVDGVVNGADVSAERPIEFFIPSGQLSSEHQWITATMRNLSLVARGGYITQALQDLRKVAWDKGPVRCGKNRHNKPMYHDSVVAAVAWSIQQILYQRGFLDIDGQQVPLKELTHPTITNPTAAPKQPAQESTLGSIGTCGTCEGTLKLLDGCPTCVDCGWSKCN